LGSFVVGELLSNGWRVAAVGRSEQAFREAALPAEAQHILSTAEEFSPALRDALDQADGVAICLPIQLAGTLVPQLEALFLPDSKPPRIVALSSMRRHSQVSDPTVREVIEAEARWAPSALEPVLLRATMIFGDHRDRNMARLFAWAKKRRWIPAPAWAGKVQPVFAPDLARAVRAALEVPRDKLNGALPADRAIDIAGERPVELRELFRESFRAAAGCDPWLLPAPLWGLKLGAVAGRFIPGFPKIGREQIERLAEDKTADLTLARELLDFQPRPLEDALRLKARWLPDDSEGSS
jgi:uncharacterized protein YbjT (DUF2867 family)